jgi:hypothetical protein
MDHLAIDTQMVHLLEHRLMAADDPALQWIVAKLRQPSSVTALGNIIVIGNNGGMLQVVWKELCYRKAETLGDVEEAARW